MKASCAEVIECGTTFLFWSANRGRKLNFLLTKRNVEMTFKLRESGIHDYAKQKVEDWINKDGVGDAMLEYPIIPKWSTFVLDEMISCPRISCKHTTASYCKHTDGNTWVEQKCGRVVPTYDFCVKNGHIPVAVVDIAVQRKGTIYEIWEITYTHKLTKEKVNKIINAMGDVDIYEISAEWVMKQDVHTDPRELYKKAVKVARKWADRCQRGCGVTTPTESLKRAMDIYLPIKWGVAMKDMTLDEKAEYLAKYSKKKTLRYAAEKHLTDRTAVH